MIEKCMVCASLRVASILNFGSVSPSSQSFFPKPTEIPKKHLDLWFCEDCFHIQNSAFDGYSEKHYGENYVVSLSHSPQALKIYEGISRRLIEHLQLDRNAKIVEIGCGDGTFLATLVKIAGLEQASAFEPSGLFELAKSKPGLKVENRLYASEDKKNPVDLLISRHVFEHVENPQLILNGVSAKAIYIEVPRIEDAMKHSMYADFYYDHIHYFTQSSFEVLLNRAGYEVAAWDIAPLDEWMGVIARPAQKPGRTKRERPQFAAFVKNWAVFKIELSRQIAKLKTDGHRIAVWGAGARGVTLIDNLQLSRDSIDILVDSDPHKRGKFLPNSSWQVTNPETFFNNPTSVVLITAATYAEEIRQTLISRLGAGRVKIFTLYPFRELS